MSHGRARSSCASVCSESCRNSFTSRSICSPATLVEEASFRKGLGCDECRNTGFAGRSALTEMLLVDEVLRDAILKKLPTRALQEVAIGQGMQTLWHAGIKRVASGETTLEEIVRVVSSDQI